MQPYAHEEVCVECATTVATGLPTSDGEPNDVAPRNFFYHTLKPLLDIYIGSRVCEPFICPFLHQCNNRVACLGHNGSVPILPWLLQLRTEGVR